MKFIHILRRMGVIILFIISFQKTFSQENYLPGYVIKQDADTLYGYLDYRNWEKNPNKINFVKEIGDKQSTFTPNDISEFKVSDEIYLSAVVEIEISSNRTESLGNSPQMNFMNDTTFLQTLVRGEKSLYYYKHVNGKDYFYISNGGDFDLLQYKRYLKYGDGNPRVVDNNKYVGQLVLYLTGCESLKSKLDHVSYKKNSLTKIFQDYYECTQSGFAFKKTKEEGHSEFGVFAGSSITSVKFSSTGFPHLTQGHFNTSVDPSVGLFYNFTLPRNQGKLSIQNELQYTTYEVSGYYEEVKSANEYFSTASTVGSSYLKLNILLRYKFPVGPGFMFLNGGLSNGFTISETNYYKKESTFYYDEKTSEGRVIEDPRNYEQSYILGAGYLRNKISVEARYEKGNGMSNTFNLGHLTTRYYLLIGFKLNKGNIK
jgi:hypothetical protein